MSRSHANPLQALFDADWKMQEEKIGRERITVAFRHHREYMGLRQAVADQYLQPVTNPELSIGAFPGKRAAMRIASPSGWIWVCEDANMEALSLGLYLESPHLRGTWVTIPLYDAPEEKSK